MVYEGIRFLQGNSVNDLMVPSPLFGLFRGVLNVIELVHDAEDGCLYVG